MRYTCIMYNEYYGKQLSHTFADTLNNVWEFTLALENLFPQQNVQQQDNTWWNQCNAFTTSLRISYLKCITKVRDSSL